MIKKNERRIKWLRTRACNLRREAIRCNERQEFEMAWEHFCDSDILLARAKKLEAVK